MFSDDFFGDDFFPSYFPPDAVTVGPPPPASVIAQSNNYFE
jgi:hypothetical protein